MATVLEFPSPTRSRGHVREAAPAAPRALPTAAGRYGEYAIADVARSLGLLQFSVRTIIDKLRALAKHDGMPLPRTPRVVKERGEAKPLSGVLVIYSKSRWDAGEFDAWLDGRGPAAPAAALPRPLRHEMAQRAVAIGTGR